jgi:hypothetical protein
MTCQTRAETDFEAYLLAPSGPEWERFRTHFLACPECSTELALYSRLERVLQVAAAPAGSAHPSEERLLAFQGDATHLPAEERASIGEHLRSCVVCREALAALADLEPRLSAIAAGRPQRRPGPLRTSGGRGLKFAAAAALVGLLSLGWLVWSQRDLPRGALPEPASEVAALEAVEPDRLAEPAPPPRAAEAPAPVAPESLRDEQTFVTETEASREAPAAPVPGKAPSRLAANPPAAMPPAPPATRKQTAAPGQPASRKQGSEPGRELVVASLAASGPLLYVPPEHAAPSARVGARTRSAAPDLPSLLALAPEHEGFTASESPTLYWFLSQESKAPGRFVLVHPDRIDPVVEVTIPPPIAAGIHAVDLAKRGVVLEPGTQYRWFVSLVPDPTKRSSDVVGGGVVRRIAPDERVRAEIEKAEPSQIGHVYARNGLFYDALAFVSKWIDRAPGEPRLRELRAGLLAQVGLGEAAGSAPPAPEPREPRP